MSRSCLYVAVSRATCLAGLYLVGKFRKPNPPTGTDSVEEEMKRLNELAICEAEMLLNQIDASQHNNQNTDDREYHFNNFIADMAEGDLDILEANSNQYFNDVVDLH